MELSALEALYERKREQFFRDYFDLLRFPSVSTEAAHHGDVLRCSEWVADYLRRGGFEVETWPSSGNPVIFASWNGAGAEAPTVMFYGHYDVQPVDPLELWTSPPFEPQIRNGEIYARGAEDNKGQLFFVMSALRSIFETEGRFPLNVKLVIEGEEESGSRGFRELLAHKSDRLQAEYLAIVDVGMKAIETPWVIVGVRGISTFEITVRGSESDLHSGNAGGIAYNPNRALVEILSKAVDAPGRVAIPGFYDRVVDLTPEEREMLVLDVDDDACRKHFGVEPTGGEKGRSPAERLWLRPTFEINGISGGYSGDGFKTVIPARASAKLSCRLVPDQDPDEIERLVTEFLRAQCPPGLTVEFHSHGGGKALRSSPQARVVHAAANAIGEVLKTRCGVTFEGGSIPIGTDLRAATGAEVVFFGYGLPTDAIHAPNEHFGVERIRLGFLTVGRFIEHLAKN